MERLSFFCNVVELPKQDYYKYLESKEYTTTTELARRLGKSSCFVTKLIMNNNLKALKTGGRYIVNKKIFKAFWIRNKYKFNGVKYAAKDHGVALKDPDLSCRSVPRVDQDTTTKLATTYDWRVAPTAHAIDPAWCVDLDC